VLAATATVLVLAVGGVAGYAWYLNAQIHRIAVKNLTASPKSGVTKGTENILMVGSTSRCALKVQNPAYGLCSDGVTGVNSDVVMILHLNWSTHSLSILSIPRDLFVPNARAEGANKIDAALYEGPSQLVAAIQEDLGIPIQHYVELNFDTFANVVDALGGIKMYFPEPVYDSYSGLDVPTPGCRSLNGVQALQVVRARHLQYQPPGVTTTDVASWPADPQSDLSRIRRDHEFLRVLATAVAKKGISNPLTDAQIVSAVASQLEVDSGMSASQMVHLVLGFHSVNANGAPQLTLPIVLDLSGSYHYKGGNYGDVVWPDEPQDHQVVDQFLGVGSTTDTLTATQVPSPAAVTVGVRNGTGSYAQAATTAASLKALGFQATVAGDSPSVGSVSETVVYYSATTRAETASAQAVAGDLSGSVVMALDPAMVAPGTEVTVVTGTNFTVTRPTPATPPQSSAQSSTVAPSTSTTVVAGTTASSPTASVEALTPWDPRSCTPAGGEGT
jgi:LCP family protein required for cell wall assembly